MRKSNKYRIRNETDADIGAIAEVTIAAFKTLEIGFGNPPGLVLEGVPPDVFFALSFNGHTPQGTVTFHEGFKADGQQGAAAEACTLRIPGTGEGAIRH